MKYLNLVTIIFVFFYLNKGKAQSFTAMQKIVASDRAIGDEFGHSVSISGSYAIVGAYQEDHDVSGGSTKNRAGSAYFYERDGDGTWNQVQKVVASDRADLDNFARSVSISGNYAILGAHFEDHNASGGSFLDGAGSAYIFERDGGGTWNQVQKIVASDRGADDDFGRSVSISGSYAIVGAYEEDEDVSGGSTKDRAGSAYIYERDGGGTWNQVQKIVASDRNEVDFFGWSVSISGDYAIVGARFEDEDASGGGTISGTGSAYIYERDGGGTWNQVQKIVASDRGSADDFGQSVSISGNYAIVGAWREDQDASGGNTKSNAGSAYIYERDGGGTWNQVQKIVASDRDASDEFGWSTSISGNYAVVGAYREAHDASGGDAKSNAGSAYIYERDGGGTWNQVQKIVASDRTAEDWFGVSVAISGSYVAFGADKEDEDASGNNTLSAAGSVYISEGTGLLPIELTIFNTQWYNETQTAALLEWTTETEINNQYFYIERSTDAIHFEDIARVDGAGDAFTTLDYKYIDDALPEEKTTLFYRLRQQDYDGSTTYSQIEVLQPSEGLDIITLYPNPNFGVFKYLVSSSLETEIVVKITDYLGKTVREEIVTVEKGVNEFNMNVEELRAGNYVLQLETSKGLYNVSSRFVMQDK